MHFYISNPTFSPKPLNEIITMALDSNGRIGKWSHMRSNLEDFDFGVFFWKNTFQIFKIGKKSRENGSDWDEIGFVPDFGIWNDGIWWSRGPGVGSKFGFRGFPVGLVFRGHFWVLRGLFLTPPKGDPIVDPIVDPIASAHRGPGSPGCAAISPVLVSGEPTEACSPVVVSGKLTEATLDSL